MQKNILIILCTLTAFTTQCSNRRSVRKNSTKHFNKKYDIDLDTNEIVENILRPTTPATPSPRKLSDASILYISKFTNQYR
jgi:hypothetical protein